MRDVLHGADDHAAHRTPHALAQTEVDCVERRGYFEGALLKKNSRVEDSCPVQVHPEAMLIRKILDLVYVFSGNDPAIAQVMGVL